MAAIRRFAPFCALLALSCAAGVGTEPDLAGDDLVVGVGGKADEGDCDPTSELCWPTADAEAMRDYLAAWDELISPSGDAVAAGRRLAAALDALSHKLDDAARAELPGFRARASWMTAATTLDERSGVAEAAHRIAGARLVSGYLTANAVPLGAAASDDRADDGSLPPGPLPSGQLTPDMRASLDELRAAGTMGTLYAFMVEHFGVLDREYRPLREAYPFSEPREERVARIISDTRWASARASGIANAEALIPYAGIVISIGHGAIMQLRLRARMVLDIAETYGIDPREGDGLLVSMMVLMACYGLDDARAAVIATAALPLVIGLVERAASAVTVNALLRSLLRRAIRQVLGLITTVGAEMVAEAGARAAAVGTGRQVLGYATFGLALVADIALTTYTTSRVGEHAASMLRPWGTGMLTEGATFLSSPARSDCAASVLAETALADGTVAPEERALLAAHLGRAIWSDGAWRPMNDNAALARQASIVADAWGGVLDGCVDATFVGEDEHDRVALVSWARTVAAVDGSVDAAEGDFVYELETALRGSGWIGDGNEIEDETLDDVRRRIELVLLPADDGTHLDPELTIEELARGYPHAEAALAATGF